MTFSDVEIAVDLCARSVLPDRKLMALPAAIEGTVSGTLAARFADCVQADGRLPLS
ncbi:MAG: hypothetical protein ABIR32_02075 [Ilumatobacteraceae bacterium]